MYKPCHLMGLELGISVLSGALRGERTEQPQGWRRDVVAVAKRELRTCQRIIESTYERVEYGFTT